jgi:hypothetical protein
MFYEPENSLKIDLIEAMRFYMKQYFTFLQTSGNHVLFDLPDFDDNKYRPQIDYSLIHNNDLDDILQHLDRETKLLGTVDCSLVVQFYKMLWQTAIGLREQRWGSLEVCLASICSDWVIGSPVPAHFFINFNAPTVEVLCSEEVILSFNIKQLGFFTEGNISET